VKYLPKFVGNFELRVKFGYAGMVVTGMPYDFCVRVGFKKYFLIDAPVTPYFTPLFESFKCVDKFKTSATTTTMDQQFDMQEFKVLTCYSILHCFGIDANVYQALMSRYSQTALAFPIQTLTFQPMNGNLKLQPDISLSLTTTPRFVDSIFILFPLNNHYRTCYLNPQITDWSLKMGGYGQVPDVATGTWTPKFYELCANAMNMNNDSQSFNKEVERSLTYHDASGNIAATGVYSRDISNFFIGIPTETDYTFQQGLTSNSAITYYFKGTGARSGDLYNSMSSNPLMGFLKDSVLAIQLREGGTPIISLDEYDI
jgi:hypothetical protein